MCSLKQKFQMYKGKMTVRASTLVTPFGVGAMIDMPDWVLMTVSGEYWDKKRLTVIHDERLENILHVKGFKSPVVKPINLDEEDESNSNFYMKFTQFPKWYFCPNCRSFKPLNEWEKDYKKVPRKKEQMEVPRCSNKKCKNSKLAPARLVVACENGHLDDFPWVEWTHLKAHKKICDNPRLKIKTSGVTSGLEGISIECENCGAFINLNGTFSKDESANEFEKLENSSRKNDKYGVLIDEDFSLKCSGNRPWDGTKEKCNLYPTTVQRGAVNVYFPKIESSIVIPPYSDKYTKAIGNSEGYNTLLNIIDEVEGDQEFIDNIVKKKIPSIAKETAIDESIVRKIVERKLKSQEDENEKTMKDKYKEAEYKALIGEIKYDILNQADFKIENVEVKKYNKSYLKRVVLIHKMREVKALVGFSRLNAVDNNIMDGDEEETAGAKHSKLIRPLSDKNWYPAIEVNGEGIFIELDEELISKWIEENPEVQKRIDSIDKKYYKLLTDKNFSIRRVTPKFVLLHTFAHLIIKELSFKCGYSSTSLRERIYCNSSESDFHMCGIMIYTANGDAEGTLGGLVRQGKSDRLPEILDNAIEKARFCSSDPVCIESMGQGRDALNLAACFSCCLISETSCEEFNTLLDRALIVGTLDNSEIGFFNYLK